jgi:hypothetical protein
MNLFDKEAIHQMDLNDSGGPYPLYLSAAEKELTDPKVTHRRPRLPLSRYPRGPPSSLELEDDLSEEGFRQFKGCLRDDGDDSKDIGSSRGQVQTDSLRSAQ